MTTYRHELEDAIIAIAATSIGGSPWNQDAEGSIQRLLARLRETISADPVLIEIFERARTIAILHGCGKPEEAS